MAGADPHVVALHTAVPGRARLRVRGLYRCLVLKRRIEAKLPDSDGIVAVSASVLTGTVLVRFSPTVQVSSVIARIELLIVAMPATHQGQGDQPIVQSARSDRTASWHTLTVRRVVQILGGSSARGLAHDVAAERLRQNGSNRLPSHPTRSRLLAFLDQFKSLPVMLLLGSAALSIATGGIGDAVAIVAVVLLNATIGFVTERQAESRIAALLSDGRMAAVVYRGGELYELPADDVVPGDLLFLQRGSPVPADARIVRAHGLRVDESGLTGESLPVTKSASRLTDDDTPIADRTNMLYRGTMVTGGDAAAIVVATGAETEIGRLQRLVLDATRPETPLQRQLRELGTAQVMIAAGVSGAVFLAGLLRGHSVLEMVKSAVSLAVAAIPEGLPVVATTALASGLNAMRRDDILVRRLAAIETLGAIEIACLDKTGTLTTNRMSAASVCAGNETFDVIDGRITNGGDVSIGTHASLKRLLEICVLCSEGATAGNGNRSVRSSTEGALLELATAAGVDPQVLADRYPLRAIRLRSDKRSFMTTWHASGDGTFIAMKGNPVDVLRRCSWHIDGGRPRRLSPSDRAAIEAENSRMANRAMRVLGLAYAESDQTTNRLNGGATWAGLVGMADPLRPGMPEFVRELRQAGITPVMITGDQTATAHAIGRRLGMNVEREVFARVNPSDKLKVLRNFQKSNRVAAMTGDGVNDAPALKAADVGITLGRDGTEVAQDVADVVLANDDIASLIVAIREGRRVQENVRHAIHYLTATNLSELLMMFASVACGLGTPLNTRQLLWINLLSDIFPELAFATEPGRDNLLARPPRGANAPVIGRADYRRLVREAGVLSASALAGYAYGVSRYGIGARSSTIGFVTLAAGQLLHALTIREPATGSNGQTAGRRGWVGRAAGAGLLVVLASQLLPGIGQLLGATQLGPADLIASAAASALGFGINHLMSSSASTAARPSNSVLRAALA